MIFLGIDPGTRRMGYGLVEKNGQKVSLVAAGILSIDSKNDHGALLEIKRGLSSLIDFYKPEFLAIEKLYFSKNQKTALQVAEARGVALLAGMEAGLGILEYSPNEVKSNITGYGSADKKAVLKMVGMILGQPKMKIIDDASDALALGILAAWNAPFAAKKS